MNKGDVDVLRELGRQLHEIAVLPVQEEKRRLWRALNDLNMVRPLVMIDQIPWHEMDVDGSLACVVSDPPCGAVCRHLILNAGCGRRRNDHGGDQHDRRQDSTQVFTFSFRHSHYLLFLSRLRPEGRCCGC